MKKQILLGLASILTAGSLFAGNGDIGSVDKQTYDPKFSVEVAICEGRLNYEQKEITIFRDRNDKSRASILYKTVNEKGSMLFTAATTKRVGDSLETKHGKLSITIDLSSEKADKSMSGKWDDEVSLTCKLVYPYID